MIKDAETASAAPVPKASAWRRLAPLAILLALMALGYAMGLHKYFSLQSIAENRAALETFTSQYWLLSLIAFMVIYVVSVALSVPGASVLTVIGGLLFGWFAAGVAVVISATAGAVIIFLVVRTAVGEFLVRKAGPALSKLRDGFARDSFNYLLFLRLVPAFPFWLVNIAAGLANVSLRTFVTATTIGIVPATFTFAYLGQGLDSVIEAQNAARLACVAEKGEGACPFALSLSSLVTKEILIAFAALAVLALIPIALRRWRRHA